MCVGDTHQGAGLGAHGWPHPPLHFMHSWQHCWQGAPSPLHGTAGSSTCGVETTHGLVHTPRGVETDPPHPWLCSALRRLSMSELSPRLHTANSAAQGFTSEEDPGWRDLDGIPGGWSSRRAPQGHGSEQDPEGQACPLHPQEGPDVVHPLPTPPVDIQCKHQGENNPRVGVSLHMLLPSALLCHSTVTRTSQPRKGGKPAGP